MVGVELGLDPPKGKADVDGVARWDRDDLRKWRVILRWRNYGDGPSVTRLWPHLNEQDSNTVASSEPRIRDVHPVVEMHRCSLYRTGILLLN